MVLLPTVAMVLASNVSWLGCALATLSVIARCTLASQAVAPLRIIKKVPLLFYEWL